jgi:xylulokinase
MTERFGAEYLFQTTGRLPRQGLTIPTIRWMRDHEPELFGRTAMWHLPHSYLTKRMCGRSVVDHSLAAGTIGYDENTLAWSDAICDWAGCSPRSLPEIDWGGQLAGKLTAHAAVEFGILPGIPVVIGGQDQKVAAFAAGIEPGTATLSLGTAAALSVTTSDRRVDPNRRIPVSPFVREGTWVLEGVIPSAGASIEWFARLLSTLGDATISPEGIFTLASQAPVGARDVRFIPNLAGPGTAGDPEKAGRIEGIRIGTSAADLSRALLEGVAVNIQDNVRAIGDLGTSIERLMLFGGGARSDLWCQIIGDYCRLPVVVSGEKETAAKGAAFLAIDYLRRHGNDVDG